MSYRANFWPWDTFLTPSFGLSGPTDINRPKGLVLVNQNVVLLLKARSGTQIRSLWLDSDNSFQFKPHAQLETILKIKDFILLLTKFC